MAKAPTVYAFPDTNYFLHYEWFRNVDWRRELNAKNVCLVVAPIVHSELNKFKDDKANGRRRNRSRDTLSEFKRMGLKELLQGVSVRDSGQVTLRVLTKKPDMSAYPDLQKDHADDQLIATVLSFQAACDPGNRVVLVTGDGPLISSAYAWGVDVFDPEHLKLADEKDDATRKIEDLEREIRRLLQAEPQMAVAFAIETGSTSTLHINRVIVSPWNQQQLDSLVTREAVAIKANLSNSTDIPRLEYAARERNDENLPYRNQEYQKKAQSFLKQYSQYVQDALAYADEYTRACPIRLTAANTGMTAAKGVAITVTFPDAFRLCDKDDLLDRPIRPKRPVIANTVYDIASMFAGLNTPMLPNIGAHLSNVAQSNSRYIGPFFDQKHPNQVRYEFGQLIHGTSLTLRSFVSVFPHDWEGAIVPVLYHVNIGNKVDAIDGALEIAVDDTREVDALRLVEMQAQRAAVSRRS